MKEFVALAPPRGFDAKALPVTSVQIFYTRGDRVAEVWGKGTTVFLFGPFRLTDITAPLRTALPAGNTNPKVETVVFDGPGYVTTLPHYFNTVFGNYCTYTRSTPPSPISTAARPTPAPTPVPSPSPSPVPRAPRGNESGVLMQMKLTDKSFQEAKPANNTASIAKDDSAVVPGDRPVAAPASRPAGPNGRPDGNSLWWRPPGEASK